MFYNKRMKLSSSARIQTALETMGIYTYEDVLMHLPRAYEDLSITEHVLKVDRQRVVLSGVVATQPKLFRHGRFSSVTFKFLAHDQQLYSVVAFNRPFFLRAIQLKTTYRLLGIYDQKRSSINLTSLLKDDGNLPILKPIYRLPDEIQGYVFTRLVKKALSFLPTLTFSLKLPESFYGDHHVMSVIEALKVLHFPTSLDEVEHASRVFKFEEAYAYFVYMKQLKEAQQAWKKPQSNTIAYGTIVDKIERLPYRLTSDQLLATDEIIHDMNHHHVMHRLLQGDVGSGKTVVAALALFANVQRHQQGVLMAPTDTLAKQHYLTLSQLFTGEKIRLALLVGSLTAAEKKAIKEALIEGTVDICVGTHAVFSEDVSYHDLGLVVIDEQHRFGIQQREKLRQKGPYADYLMMSATPIPRSLAMTVYANMDVSTLTQFPFLERKVETLIVQEENALIDYHIQLALEAQQRVYILAPAIEESLTGKQTVDALFHMYQTKYPTQVAMMHGRLKPEEKEAIFSEFAQGKKPILVSTTVIEVGLDVKEATLMIIHDANTFGLATLHQLRGRIGRDGSPATCLFVIQEENLFDHERLNVLVKTNDGFVIAEQDLALRGPGEIFGERQAGMPSFHVLNLVKDHKIIEAVRKFMHPHLL